VKGLPQILDYSLQPKPVVIFPSRRGLDLRITFNTSKKTTSIHFKKEATYLSRSFYGNVLHLSDISMTTNHLSFFNFTSEK
jgi:hypothetical protein